MGTRPNAQSLIAGVAGSFVGGLGASLLSGDGLALRPSGLIGSVIGAIIVLLIWRAMLPLRTEVGLGLHEGRPAEEALCGPRCRTAPRLRPLSPSPLRVRTVPSPHLSWRTRSPGPICSALRVRRGVGAAGRSLRSRLGRSLTRLAGTSRRKRLGGLVAGATPQGAVPGVDQIKAVLGPWSCRHKRDALLLHLVGVTQRADMGKHPVLQPDEEHDGELQTLCVVQGHEGDRTPWLPRGRRRRRPRSPSRGTTRASWYR